MTSHAWGGVLVAGVSSLRTFMLALHKVCHPRYSNAQPWLGTQIDDHYISPREPIMDNRHQRYICIHIMATLCQALDYMDHTINQPLSLALDLSLRDNVNQTNPIKRTCNASIRVLYKQVACQSNQT